MPAATFRQPETSDFTPIAERYDATRAVPPPVLRACYERLTAMRLFPPGGVVLDAGCGTGQISLPLAERGYEVRGIDISADMARRAQAKLPPGQRAEYQAGDVRAMRFAEATFDAAVVSKLFQHVADWRAACRELIRVVRPGAPIAHVNERGAFGNAVRRFFAQRADALGFVSRYLGADPHSYEEVAGFMTARGCRRVAVDTADLRWPVEVSYGEALDRLAERLYPEFWYLPRDVHDRLVADTAAWVAAQPQGRDSIERLTPRLAVEVFLAPGGSQ